MTWCTSLIPHHTVNHYYYLIHRHWVIPTDTHLPTYISSPSSLLPYSSLPNPTRLANPKQFLHPELRLRFCYIQKQNLNIEWPGPFSCSLVSIWNPSPGDWTRLRDQDPGAGCVQSSIASQVSIKLLLYVLSSFQTTRAGWDLQRFFIIFPFLSIRGRKKEWKISLSLMLLETGDPRKRGEIEGVVAEVNRWLCPPMPMTTALEGTSGAFHLLHIKSLGTRRQKNKQDTVRMGFPSNIWKISSLSRASWFTLRLALCLLTSKNPKTKTPQGLAKLCNLIYK